MQEKKRTRNLGIRRARATYPFHLIARRTGINTQLRLIESIVAQYEWIHPVQCSQTHSYKQWLKCLGTHLRGVPPKRRSCISDYWQTAFLHLQVHKNAQQWKAERYVNNKLHFKKRKANMASNIHSHQHLMGPALMAGGPR